MSSPALGRRDLALLVLAAGAVLATYSAALGVRLPGSADLGWMLAVNGPRLLLAAAVGAGLGVSAVVAQASSPSSLREAYTLAVSFGGAFGGTRALDLGLLGPAPDFLLGAGVGAMLFAGVVGLLARVPALSGVLVGIAMFAMGILALLAAVAAKGDAWGVRPVVWWALGDFSRAGWEGSGLSAASITAIAAALLVRAGPGAMWGELEGPRRRELVVLGAVLWGVSIGAGGVIAWFGLMVALAARRLLSHQALRPWLALAALLGALAMMGVDVGPRYLVGGYAFPVGPTVAMLAVPWFLAWGRLGRLPRSRRAALAVRGADFAAAVVVAGVVGGFVGVLTLIVRAL
ncbi:MAG: iron chelate uptake ABC transporter family permease subunit [Myxococcota bacterium]